MTVPIGAGFDPVDPAVLRDPYPYYAWLLRHDPVHRGANGIWYVTRYDDVRTVLGEARFGRAGIRDFWASLVGPGPLSEVLRHTIFFQDDPDHERLRSLIGPAFTPRLIRRMGAEIEQTARDLLRPLRRRGEMDLVDDFAYPLALATISTLLGMPARDRDALRAWSVDIAPTLDLLASPEEIARGQAAMGQFAEYLTELIAERRRSPGDDLISAMIEATGGQRPITTNALIGTAVALVFAGHDTVTNQIGNGVLAFLRHPRQLELLRAEPDRLAGAVEECLRYDSSVQSNSRQISADLDLSGTKLPEGAFVVALAGAANRDPAQFTDPDRFDIRRSERPPMSFGAGMRFCLGALLARMELKAALGQLAGLAELRQAVPTGELVYRRSTMFRGVVSLPITFAATP
ncbi:MULTISPECIES: cytochrome P450 [Nonomuraea]|uniref:Cytochrome P450 n=1 Tax=Nonomuraea ferruginea TaxID=46174 RepID=A0ABT4T6B3_9ACTN|nr:cytochrome P450 [Nonomuraea ferruginea]MDA0645058.1 cytochrome P450 [Nonomuraea ferruginea]